MDAPVNRSDRQYVTWAGWALIALLAFRLVILWLNPLGLHGDEAQYWAWSQDPAFGYYSKPPLIAWIISLTTGLFGQAEWAVRLASPWLHFGTTILLFLSAKRLYDVKTGLLAGALYVLMPGVALSSALISTDAALLFCVALFLYFWVRSREEPGWGIAIGLGFAFGLGMLAKYAMIYVLPAFCLAILLDPKTRRALSQWRWPGVVLTGFILLLPNLLWNADNQFATLVHTSDNANLQDGVQINPGELGEFLLGQLGVFGPVTFILLLVAFWRSRQDRRDFELWLALLALTPLLFICVQALISRANANWAAAAYASAAILLAGWAMRTHWVKPWVIAGLVINLFASLVPALVITSPQLTNQLGFANAVKRLRGWPETVDAIEANYADGTFDAVAVDNRLLFYDLSYYGMEDTAPLFMWRYEPRLNSHAELVQALPEDDRPVLLVSYFETYDPYFRRDFEKIEPLGLIEIDLGGGKQRTLRTYAASGYKGPVWRD